jgi:hypothetical protein
MKGVMYGCEHLPKGESMRAALDETQKKRLEAGLKPVIESLKSPRTLLLCKACFKLYGTANGQVNDPYENVEQA